MRAEPDLVALGSNAYAIDEDGAGCSGTTTSPARTRRSKPPTCAAVRRSTTPPSCSGPAAVKQVGGYRKQFMPCEDFDLWLRLGEVGRLANLPEKLLTKRLFVGSAVATELGETGEAG